MYYDSTSLRLNMTDPNIMTCCPAGNSSLINSNKYLLSSTGSKSNKSNTEYENMLFETHGCSVYHHQRIKLLDNDYIETEF